jgi:hypothetical protein
MRAFSRRRSTAASKGSSKILDLFVRRDCVNCFIAAGYDNLNEKRFREEV